MEKKSETVMTEDLEEEKIVIITTDEGETSSPEIIHHDNSHFPNFEDIKTSPITNGTPKKRKNESLTITPIKGLPVPDFGNEENNIAENSFILSTAKKPKKEKTSEERRQQKIKIYPHLQERNVEKTPSPSESESAEKQEPPSLNKSKKYLFGEPSSNNNSVQNSLLKILPEKIAEKSEQANPRNESTKSPEINKKVAPPVNVNPYANFPLLNLNKLKTQLMIDASSKYQENFVELKKLGHGSFSSVYLCKARRDGFVYAVKRTTKELSPVQFARAQNEVYVLSYLQYNKYLLRYLSSWEEDNRLFIQTEYCIYGSLEQMMKAGKYLEESDLITVTRHICKGLKYLHSCGLAHRDVKPENIYQNKDNIYKLGDFGMAISLELNDFEETETLDFGDSRYSSPEAVRGNVRELKYHLSKSDIFSLGCSLYELATRKALTPEINESLRKTNLKLSNDWNATFSSDFTRLLLDMLLQDPGKRPSAAKLLTYKMLQSETKKNFMTTEENFKKLKEEADEKDKLIVFLQHQLALQQQQIQSFLEKEEIYKKAFQLTKIPKSPLDNK